MWLSLPSALFHELGFRFDEELDTCEDWNMELRAVLACGVATSLECIAIYRRWRMGHASNTVHGRQVWQADHSHHRPAQRPAARIFPGNGPSFARP